MPFKKLNTKVSVLLAFLLAIILAESLIIGRLYYRNYEKKYEVNLVKINTEKDSIDYPKLKQDLTQISSVVGDLKSFLDTKNIASPDIDMLHQDSLSSVVYLSKQANRYSQYLYDLQQKLYDVPLGLPTDGYISSNFGNRRNPIPPKPKTTATPAAAKTTPTTKVKSTAAATTVAAAPTPVRRKVIDARIVEEKDSMGNIIKKVIPIYAPEETVAAVTKPTTSTVPPAQPSAPPAAAKFSTIKPVKELNNAPAEQDQLQFHKGIDIAVPFGSDVHCTAQGTVIFAGPKGGYGNCVIVSHGNGLATLYAHLSQILVKPNDRVKVNQVIAKSGNSGRSTGPHLHYEVHRNNQPVNPKLFLNF